MRSGLPYLIWLAVLQPQGISLSERRTSEERSEPSHLARAMAAFECKSSVFLPLFEICSGVIHCACAERQFPQVKVLIRSWVII